MLKKHLLLLTLSCVCLLGCTARSLKLQSMKAKHVYAKSTISYFVGDKHAQVAFKDKQYQLFIDPFWVPAEKMPFQPLTLIGRYLGFHFQMVFPTSNNVPEKLNELAFFEVRLRKDITGELESLWGNLTFDEKILSFRGKTNIPYDKIKKDQLLFLTDIGFFIFNPEENWLRAIMEHQKIKDWKTESVMGDVMVPETLSKQ